MADNLPDPASRKESYLAKAAGMDVTIPERPESRVEQYLEAIAEGGGGGGGDTVYSDKSTSDSTTGGAVYIGNLNSNQEEQPDPTTVDLHQRYFWALPYNNAQKPHNSSINIFGQNDGNSAVTLGANAVARLDEQIAIGPNTLNNYSATNGIAIGKSAQCLNAYSVAVGKSAKTTRDGEFNIGAGTSGDGYNNTNYRIIGGVHDPVDAHDAATKGYVDSQAGGGDTVYSTVTTSNSNDGGAVYIGPLNASQEEQPDPTTTDNHRRYFWALPFDTSGNPLPAPGNETINIGGVQVSGSSDSVTLGYRSKCSGSNNTHIGFQAQSDAYGSCVSVGSSAQCHSNYGTALGRMATVSANNVGSVALGSGAETSRAGEINVGTISSYNYASYNNTGYRVIGGVHDGQLAQDAVTVSQVNSVIDAINTALSTNIQHIGQLVESEEEGYSAEG